jgi:DNA polymerase III epsilon subunit-like protein
MRYLVLDTETGGFEGTSLLTACFLVTDEAFNELDQLMLKMKPDDGKYIVTGESLRVNGIDLKTHDTEAIPYREAGVKLYDFLNGNSILGSEKLIPVGHNVVFDILKIQEFLISKEKWSRFVSYRTLDTATIARACIAAGLLPTSLSGSLSSIAEYFNIDTSAAHSADGDVAMAVLVLENLLGVMRGGKR